MDVVKFRDRYTASKLKKNNFNCNGCAFNKMEVIETIVIQNSEVEGKETVVSSVDTDKTKAG